MEKSAPETFEARLRKLEDLEEIRNLRMRYHAFINDGLFDRVGELYTDDAVIDFSPAGKASGIESIRAFYLQIPRNLDFVKQFIHNHMVDLDGDRASGISYMEARYARDGESVMVALKFNERYRRTPSGWRISETLTDMYFTAPLQKGWAGGDRHTLKPFTN